MRPPRCDTGAAASESRRPQGKVSEVQPRSLRRSAVSLVRVHNFSISLDDFGTGEPQSHHAPFGHAGERLHEWMLTTRWSHEMHGGPGGPRGLDDAFERLHAPGSG